MRGLPNVTFCTLTRLSSGNWRSMPSNMLSFINFEPLELYWTYFWALQITTPKIPPIRLMSLDHELKMRWCAISLNYGLWRLFLCKYELFLALEVIFPESMIMLTWCESPMKWSHVVWKKFSSTQAKHVNALHH